MEGCFAFQWGVGLFFRWGASFLSGGCGFEKIVGWGGVPPPMPPLPVWENLYSSNKVTVALYPICVEYMGEDGSLQKGAISFLTTIISTIINKFMILRFVCSRSSVRN